MFLPFLAISWKNLLKYVDLRKGKKTKLIITDYEVINKKGKAVITDKDNSKQKVEIDERLLEFIDLARPLNIELSQLTNSLLFISHDSHNLLEEFEQD